MDEESTVKLTTSDPEPLMGSGRFLLAMGAVEFGLLVAAAWWPGRGFLGPACPLVGGAFLAYALAAYATEGTRRSRGSSAAVEALVCSTDGAASWRSAEQKRHDSPPRQSSGSSGCGRWSSVWRCFRCPPSSSDDFYRYLWDGHVQVQGINPYAHAPADSALEAVRTPWHGLINNPSVSTIYPPLLKSSSS